MEGVHIPVMTDQVLHYLNCRPEGIYCDGTVGLGGHAQKILNAASPDGRLLGIDIDSEALHLAKERLAEFGDRVVLVHGNFKDLSSILESQHLPLLNGVLLDLGVSSYQLGDKKRGFSFSSDGPLNMNFDIQGGESAAAIINHYPEQRVAEIIWKYGQERWARRIARRIMEERAKAPITTTDRLVRVICAAIPGTGRRWRIHPATRTFQALRIAVNRELENLAQFLERVWGCLSEGGRVCIISYHSLEDGMVKRYFRDRAGKKGSPGVGGRVEVLTKKPLRPTSEEVRMNPRARSARMRVAEWH